MRIARKKSLFAGLALLLSVLLHVGLLFSLNWTLVPAFRALSKAPPKPMRRIHVQTVDVRDVVFPKPALTPSSAEPRLQFSSPAERRDGITALFERLHLLPAAQPEVRVAGLGKSILAPKPAPLPPPELPVAPPPKIVEIDAAKLAPDRLTPERELVLKIPRHELVGDRVPGLAGTGVTGGAGGDGGAVEVGMRLGKVDGIPLRREELDDLERRAQENQPLNELLTPGTAVFDLGNETSGRLENLVTIRLSVYDPGTGGGFFRVDISPNPKSAKLRTIAKDMLFLIDCSASITQSKLNQFKEGIYGALGCLQPDDRFNVVAFRGSAQSVFDKLGPVSADNLAAAHVFVDRQERAGLTDVYGSIAPFVRSVETTAAYRPLNVFLLSDGRSTVSNRLDNDTFIREVVKLRQPQVSIYSFSAGSNANRFLMEMLAYSNRGGHLHIESVGRFAPNLIEFIRMHAELIVADLRYRATGELAQESYPKQLPHLYRGETLSVFGHFPEKTDFIGLQILGRDADGQEQELVFRGNLRTAQRAGPEMAKNWASQKIYYFLAERVFSPRPEINEEIRRLAQEYSIFVPYM